MPHPGLLSLPARELMLLLRAERTKCPFEPYKGRLISKLVWVPKSRIFLRTLCKQQPLDEHHDVIKHMRYCLLLHKLCTQKRETESFLKYRQVPPNCRGCRVTFPLTSTGSVDLQEALKRSSMYYCHDCVCRAKQTIDGVICNMCFGKEATYAYTRDSSRTRWRCTDCAAPSMFPLLQMKALRNMNGCE